jgi:hypothetical protein
VGKYSVIIAFIAIVASMLGEMFRLSLVLLPIGVILGITGLFQRDQSKRIAALGIVMNGVYLCVPVYLFVSFLYPEALAFTRTNHPLPWVKVITKPTVTGFLGEVRRSGEVTFYVKTSAEEWKRISFTETTYNPRLAVLSPDVILIAGIGRPRGEPKTVGEVFRRGVGDPVASIPEGNVILPIPAGGFIATRIDPDDRHQPTGITVESYNSNGERVRVWSVAIPDELADCGWAPRLRLVGDDPVYGAGMCHARSGLYLVSPNGIRLLAHFIGNAKDDYAQESSLTQAPKWSRDSWQ